MSTFLTFLFASNPRGVEYSSPSMLGLLGLCAAMIVLSFGIRFWRRKQENAVVRKLSRSWSSTIFWFGIVGLVLVVARVEGIQFVAMRFWWVLWAGLLLGYAFLQLRLFRMKYYAVIPTRPQEDPKDRYLPGKRR
jgi:hypothetical protein